MGIAFSLKLAIPGLVRAVRFRASARTQLEARTAGFSGTDLDAVERLAERGEQPGLDALPTPDRVLFWVKDVQGRAVGHVGLSHLDGVQAAVTITDVLCGRPGGDVGASSCCGPECCA